MQGGSLGTRLLLVLLVPTCFMTYLASHDILDARATVAGADSFRDLVDLEEQVAAVSAPSYIEYLAAVGLASVDQVGVDRSVVSSISGVDLEQVYRDNTRVLDAVLDQLSLQHGDLAMPDGSTLGTDLTQVRATIDTVRIQLDAHEVDAARVIAVFAQLADILDDAVAARRAGISGGRLPSELEQFRAESTALGWVLATAGDTAEAVLEIATTPGRHRETVAAAVSAHRQSAQQFAQLLPADESAPFQVLAGSSPDPLSHVPDESTVSSNYDPAFVKVATEDVMDQTRYLHTLGAWADQYYLSVSDRAAALAEEARSDLHTTVWVFDWIVIASLLLIVLLTGSMLRPLRRLSGHAHAISAGELTLEPLPVHGPRDLQTLTRAMNNMQETLRLVDQQVSALAAGHLDDHSLAEASPGRVGMSIRSSVARLAQMTQRLQASEARASAIVSYAAVAIWTIDDEGRVLSANTATEQVLLLSASEQIGRSIHHLVPTLRGECEIERVDGARLWLDIEHSVVDAWDARLRTVVAEDITERKEFERRLAQQARHDALTGLPNRFAVLEHLGDLIEHGVPAAVLFLDVDGFKSVNDTRGHAVGDEVLKEIAQRLQHAVRGDTMVARLGGDEFVVVVAGPADESAVVQLGRRLIERIEQPFHQGDALFAMSASVGVATLLPGDEPLDVVHRADSAVYQAKDLGRARVEVFSEELQARVEHRSGLELALREALGRGELDMYLQPIYDLRTGDAHGAEALARWCRPGIGFVPPVEFIDVAESSALIFELTRWMLYEACERVALWRDRDPSCSLRIAVNLSGRHLVEGDLIADLVEALSVSGADPRMIELELTETTLLADLDSARNVLETVRAMGITVAVDDFGTGFSSMAYLRQLAVDVIKVDRTFVSGADQDGFDSTAIDAMVNFGRVLGIDVVAEGVETEAQLEYVRSRGCTRAQGYLLGMPLPADETERALGLGPLVPRSGGQPAGVA